MALQSRQRARLLLGKATVVALAAALLLLSSEVDAARRKKRHPGVPPISRDYANIIKWMLVALFGPMILYFFYSIASDPTLPSLLWRALQRLGNRMYGYLGEGRGENTMTTNNSGNRMQQRGAAHQEQRNEQFSQKFEGTLYPRPLTQTNPRRSNRRSDPYAHYAPAAGPVGGNFVSERSQWEQRKAVPSVKQQRGRGSDRAMYTQSQRHVHFE
jgi:hypothetical protein